MQRVMLAAALLVLVLPTIARAQSDQAQSPQMQAKNMAGGLVGSTTANQDYVIAPQDVLNISVWKEPDLTRTIPVRPDGKISMPLLNDVQAAGLTPVQLAGLITAGLKKFVNEPQVTVIVSEINSRRIYVLGEVNHAGTQPLLPNMTVLQAVSSAGGFTIYASVKHIYVLRNENGKPQKYSFNYKDVIAGKHAEQNILVKEGDTIVVP
jgi:polysaccharide export outer membrane protein